MKSKDMSAEDMDSMQEMFSSLTGESDADPEILVPKYVELRNDIAAMLKIWGVLTNFKGFVDAFPEYADAIKQFKKYTADIEEAHGITPSTVDTPPMYTGLEKARINVLYNGLKNSDEVKAMVIAGSKLNRYKRYLDDKENLNDRFIRKEPGMEFIPVNFCPINLKAIWISERAGSMVKGVILTVLNKTLTIGLRIYRNTTSPNVDIKKFSSVLVKGIKAVKKQCPRCNDAFRIISDSVGMLEDGFDGYFKQSVEANNMSLIMENFIIDVSESQRTSPNVTRQFRKIIMFMRKKSQDSGQSQDPRVKSLFKMLNSRFSMMESSTPGYDPNAAAVDDDDEKKDSDSDETETESDSCDSDSEAPELVPDVDKAKIAEEPDDVSDADSDGDGTEDASQEQAKEQVFEIAD
jgi:hypothetical protein